MQLLALRGKKVSLFSINFDIFKFAFACRMSQVLNTLRQKLQR